MKLVVEDYRLYQEVTVDGNVELIEVECFDFGDLPMESITDEAQQRLLALIQKRQTLNIGIDEVLDCIKIPLLLELNKRRQ